MSSRACTHPWLQIYQNCSWDVSRIVALVVEHVFSIAAFCRKVFEVAILVNAVLLAKLLPELATNAVAALAGLDCDDLARHSADSSSAQLERSLWFREKRVSCLGS